MRTSTSAQWSLSCCMFLFVCVQYDASHRGLGRSRGRRREGAPEQLAADATNVNIPAAEAVQHGGTHVVQQASAPRRRDTSANAMASGVAGNTAAVMKTATSNQPAAPVTGNAAVKTAQSKPAHNAKAVPLVQTVPPPAAQGSATKPSGLPARVALPSAGLPGHAAVQHGVPRGGAANAKPAGATLLAPARNEAQPRARGANYKDWTCDEVNARVLAVFAFLPLAHASDPCSRSRFALGRWRLCERKPSLVRPPS